MPKVRVKENEPFDSAMRRFKRSCERAGTISDIRHHEYHEKPKWERRRKAAQAEKRLAKRLMREKVLPIRGGKHYAKKVNDRDKRDKR